MQIEEKATPKKYVAPDKVDVIKKRLQKAK
jgi:tetrahydromethanopterin S-methyltransferase subunit G